MSDFVKQPQAELALRTSLTPEQWAQLEGLIRRAERELALLVGPLEGQHDPELVADTLLDAVREEWVNPDRYKQEMDSSYSYTKMDLPGGQAGRFWWPSNLLDLFGIKRESRGSLKVIAVGVSPAMRGWAR